MPENSGNSTHYFVPIDNMQLDDVLRTLTEQNIETVVKMYDLHFRTHFVTPTAENTLALIKKVPYNYETLDMLCSFEIKDSNYFFKAQGSSENDLFILKKPHEIFKLQRRNDFRVTVPNSVQQTVKIEGQPDLKIEVRDISLGGCQLAMKATKAFDIPKDHFMRISLKLLLFEESKIDCEVRFSKYITETKTALIGLRFIDMTSEITTELQNTLIQIDRILRGKKIE